MEVGISPVEEKENCCGEAEVTVAEVFLKIAYGATGSSAREAVLNNGSHPSGLRLLLSPKRLKSWPLRGGITYESVCSRSMEGSSRQDVNVESVNEVKLVYGVTRYEDSSSLSVTIYSSKRLFISASGGLGQD